ncbi:MAG TPA: dynamin family protein [Streptosporangiaceae bacterium]|nr:dynamin family protein [Streptosporangiaceae bacterium]
MRGTGPYLFLSSTPDKLDALSDDGARETHASLRDRLQSGGLRVLVVGDAKRGKSGLVNAPFGREISAVVTPPTAVATTVTYGNQELTRVAFLDGRTATRPLAELGNLTRARRSPDNRRGGDWGAVEVDAPILARGVELVDTPRPGSVHEHDTAAADRGHGGRLISAKPAAGGCGRRPRHCRAAERGAQK